MPFSIVILHDLDLYHHLLPTPPPFDCSMSDDKPPGEKMSGDSLGKRQGPYDELRNDPEMEGLTLYEKKALLVNRELDSHGMGKPIEFRFSVVLFLSDQSRQRRKKESSRGLNDIGCYVFTFSMIR